MVYFYPYHSIARASPRSSMHKVLSPYPLGTPSPRPPAGALLARWPGELASLGLVSGCDMFMEP